MSSGKPLAIAMGAIVLLVVVMTVTVLLARSHAAADTPMRAGEHLQLNECVELIGVYNPQYGDSYLVASDKCGHTVAITKRF